MNDKRKDILDATLQLISDQGFHGTPMSQIAAEAGVGAGAIYRYFENKHLLLIYLVSWYWEWVSYLIDINTMNIEDPKKKLEIIIKIKNETNVQNKCVF